MIKRLQQIALHKKSHPIRDAQDDPAYWNVPTRLLNDTCRATLEATRLNPLAGYEDQDTGNPNTTLDLKFWLERHAIHPSSVGELGCGGGRLLLIWGAAIARFHWAIKLYGFDQAAGACKIADQRLKSLYPQHYGGVFCTEGGNLKACGIRLDVLYTHATLQHNSGFKHPAIFENAHAVLTDNGILRLWNEKTFSSWEDPKVMTNKNAAFYRDDRESAGTAAWWINRICAYGFELLEYQKSDYTFRKLP